VGWWFGRILTFEVVADDALTLGALLTDVSRGAIADEAADPIGGYAATGNSISDAVDPLVQGFAVDLVDDGSRLISPAANPVLVIADEDLGSGIDGKAEARIAREQTPSRMLPASAQLVYYDPDRDYQTGQSRSDVVDRSSTEEKIELPAVLTATAARSLAEQIMARRWAQRDKLVLRLPPKFMTMGLGAMIEVPGSAMLWQAGRLTMEGMVSIVEFRPVWQPQVAIGAEAGRALPANDAIISDVAVALVELPGLMTGSSVNPTVYVAATAAAPAWKRLPVEVSFGGFLAGSRTACRKSVMGYAATVLGEGNVDTLDLTNSVEVELVDADQWLASCDNDALAAGANLALIGDEFIQFASAEPTGPAKFRLTGLVRGRYASAWAISTHATGELFLLIDPASLQAVRLPPTAPGQVVTASVHSADGIVSASCLVDGRSLPGGVFIDGKQVVGSRGAGIAEPLGGEVIDSEARSSVGQILGALRRHGLIES